MISKRKHERIKVELQIAYEFVKWNEMDLSRLYEPTYSTTYDISVSGIGLFNLTNLNKKLLKQLETGKKKVRIAIYLDSINPPLITFARLIWSNFNEKENNLADKRFGFVFIDVTNFFFEELSKFIALHT